MSEADVAMDLPRTADAGETPADRLGRLFDLHHRRLHALARRLVFDGEEARDLLQEAFLRAAARPASLPADDGECAAWLARVVVNLCRDRGRRLRVRAAAQAALSRDSALIEGPEDALVARATIEAALADLSPRRRAVIVLHEIEGEEIGAIARLLGIGAVTVRWHLHAGRRALRQRLLPAGEEAR